MYVPSSNIADIVCAQTAGAAAAAAAAASGAASGTVTPAAAAGKSNFWPLHTQTSIQMCLCHSRPFCLPFRKCHGIQNYSNRLTPRLLSVLCMWPSKLLPALFRTHPVVCHPLLVSSPSCQGACGTLAIHLDLETGSQQCFWTSVFCDVHYSVPGKRDSPRRGIQNANTPCRTSTKSAHVSPP